MAGWGVDSSSASSAVDPDGIALLSEATIPVQVSGGVREVSLRLSILEVYNDNLRDLLSPNPDDPKQA